MTAIRSAAVLSAGVLLSAIAHAGEARRVEGLSFDHIDVLGSAKVQISQGDSHELLLRGDVEDLDKEPFYTDGKRLVLGTSRKAGRYNFDDLQFKVVVPELRELRVRGSGTVYVKPFQLMEPARDGMTTVSVDGSGVIKLYRIEGPGLEMRIKGSGDIKAAEVDVKDLEAVVSGTGDLIIGEIESDSAEFVVSGSGDINVTEGGFVDTVEVNVIGSGDIDLKPVSCRQAEINVVGSGSADIGIIDEQLNASVLGSGDVRYSGSPTVESVELGSGDVRQRD